MQKLNEILAIIPARAGSKRIPDKNIKRLAGRPLVEYTILSAVHCEQIAHIVISSNIPSLRRYEEHHGHLSYHPRPEVLCGDEVGDYDVINDVLQTYGYDWDLIAYLRPTTPIRADYHLTGAIGAMLAINDATGLRSVEEMSESAYKCFEMNGPRLFPVTGMAGIDMTDWPNQQVNKTYRPNGYIDLARPQIIRTGQLWGKHVIGYVTPRTVEIDTPEDWEYAEYIMRRYVDAPMRYGKTEIKARGAEIV